MDGKAILARIAQPLRSRKVRVALATVIGAYLADANLPANEHTVYVVLSVGVAVILGIAIEDHGTSVGYGQAIANAGEAANEPPPVTPVDPTKLAVTNVVNLRDTRYREGG